MKKIKNLFRYEAHELEVGVGEVNVDEKYARLYLKVCASTLMEMFDLVYGVGNWTRESSCEVYASNGVFTKSMKCTISVKKSDGEWIKNTDYSAYAPWALDNIDKVMSTDAFQRTAKAFGMGREFAYLELKFPIEKCNISVDSEARNRCYDKFVVTQIGYDEESGKISKLAVTNVTTRKMVAFADLIVTPNERATFVESTESGVTDEEIKKAKEMVCDKSVPDKFKGKALKDLSDEELIFIYGVTKDDKVRTSINTLRKADETLNAKFKKFTN